MRSILAAFILLSASANFAVAASPAPLLEDSSCLSQETVNDISKDFKFTTELEKKIDNCDLNQYHNKLFHSLAFLKYGKFQSHASNTEDFLTSSKKDFYGTLQSEASSLSIVKNCQSSGDTTVAYVNILEDTGTVHLCADNPDSSAALIAMALVHEARHLDGDGHPHVPCTQGSKAGDEGGCDTSIAAKGAYFSGLQYAATVGKYGANFHPAIKNLFRTLAASSLVTDFNEIPQMKQEKVVLLKTAQGDVVSLNAEAHLQNLAPNIEGTLFDHKDGSLVVYDAKASIMKSLNPYAGVGPAVGTLANQYNQSSDKKEILDIHYHNSINEAFGLLMNNEVEYEFLNSLGEDYDQTLPLPFKDAQRFLKASMCPGGQDKNLYIKTTEDRVFEVSLDSHQELNFNEIQSCETDLANTTTLGSTEIALNEGGVLLQKSGDNWVPVEAFKDQRFSFMSDAMSIIDFFKPADR